MPEFSAYIPCYNNAATLEKAIAGMRAQTVPVDDLFLVDDGSTDASREIAASLGLRVVEMKTNQGRGAVRARAMQEARHDLVLCGDATNQLAPDFAAGALIHFSDPQVAAVCGRLHDPQPIGVVSRWRARHLFRQDLRQDEVQTNTLVTWGAMLRKSAVLQVGNFDASYRFSEDFELGERLRRAGWEILLDPKLRVATQVQNTLGQVMERFLRWQYQSPQGVTLRSFLEAEHVALRILLPRDLQARDWPAAAISLLTPYYRLFYSRRFR
jgi:cellulose synthase/poly-beta-1,6-N-acetylglucosamine synthase-like glycosyltransferase